MVGALIGEARDLPDDSHPNTRIAYDYWQSVRAKNGHLPARADIDPLDLPAEVWPDLILSDVQMEPFSILYRLVGTAIVGIDGFDATGKRVDEVYPRRDPAAVVADYKLCIAARLPHFRRIYLFDQRVSYEILVERLHMPLATNGVDVDKFLTTFIKLD